MISTATLALVAFLPIADAAKSESDIKEVKRGLAALNEAFHKGDAAAVGQLMSDDHIAITGYYGGLADKAAQLKGLSELKLSEYRPGEMKITKLTTDAYLITYEINQKGTYKGKAVTPKCYASVVWVKRDGKWVEAFYQETALGEEK